MGEKEVVRGYLNDMRQHYAIYHNHKEAMAWAGVVLFYVLLAGVIKAAPLDGVSARFVSFGIIIVAVLVYGYAREQLRLKAYAANIIAACIFFLTESLGSDSWGQDRDAFTVIRPEEGNRYGQSPFFLPKFVQDKARELGQVGNEPGQAIEWRIMALIATGVVASLSLLMVR
jgi:hypothetical protein